MLVHIQLAVGMGQEGDFAWLQRKTTPRSTSVLPERKRRDQNSIPDVLTHARLQGKKKVHQTEACGTFDGR